MRLQKEVNELNRQIAARDLEIADRDLEIAARNRQIEAEKRKKEVLELKIKERNAEIRNAKIRNAINVLNEENRQLRLGALDEIIPEQTKKRKNPHKQKFSWRGRLFDC